MMHPKCTDTGMGHNHALILLRIPKTDVTNREMVTVHTNVRNGTLTNGNTWKCFEGNMYSLTTICYENSVPSQYQRKWHDATVNYYVSAKIQLIIFEALQQHI